VRETYGSDAASLLVNVDNTIIAGVCVDWRGGVIVVVSVYLWVGVCGCG
jgi:hypothetical protein